MRNADHGHGGKKNGSNISEYSLPFKATARPLKVPVYQTASFHFEGIEDIESVFSLKERSFIYTRGGNPTVNALEDEMAALEHGKAAVAFSSGMGAIAATLMSVLKTGDHLLAADMMYGCAREFISTILGRFGVSCSFISPDSFVDLAAHLKSNTRAIYFETPCNPTLEMISIRSVFEQVRGKNIKIVVDNTMATPICQTPLEHGADIVVHSLTKYLNGHGDVVAGMAVVKEKGVADILKFQTMCLLGSCLDPHAAHLVSRGIKTLPIRMAQHQKNARQFIDFLRSAKYVESVNSLSSGTIKCSQMKGVGGVLSFKLKATDKQICAILRRLQLLRLSVSYGDTEWLINYPLRMTHRIYLHKPGLSEFGKLSRLLRVSAGLEDSRPVIADFDKVCRSVLSGRKKRI